MVAQNSSGPEVLSTHDCERFVIKNALVLTMESEAVDELDSTSPVFLGAKAECDVVVEGGVIKAVEPNAAATLTNFRVIQGRGCVVMPGLVDSHAHPIFAGSRGTETVLKSQGLSYEEVAARGGGIVVSMRATRAATNQELKNSYLHRAKQALSRGVVAWGSKNGLRTQRRARAQDAAVPL